MLLEFAIQAPLVYWLFGSEIAPLVQEPPSPSSSKYTPPAAVAETGLAATLIAAGSPSSSSTVSFQEKDRPSLSQFGFLCKVLNFFDLHRVYKPDFNGKELNVAFAV